MGTKICTVCNKELPADTWFFQKHAKTKDGLAKICKECFRIKVKNGWDQQLKNKYPTLPKTASINNDKNTHRSEADHKDQHTGDIPQKDTQTDKADEYKGDENIISVNLTDYGTIFSALSVDAFEQVRSPAQQILFIVKQYYNK